MVYRFDVVNPSILLGGLSLDDQLQLVVQHGFDAVELWWPFPDAAPSLAEQDAVLTSLSTWGVSLVSMNLYEGGMVDGHRGLVCRSDTQRVLEKSMAVAKRLIAETGCSTLNVPHGNLTDAEPEQVQRDRAHRRMAQIADELAEWGATLLVEQLSNIDTYGVRTVEQLLETVREARALCDRGSIAIQFDTWHLARAGVDLEAFFLEHGDDAGHIQIGDMPDRGGPGMGSLPIAALIDSALARGYRGRIALEYSHFDTDPFQWMPAWYAAAD